MSILNNALTKKIGKAADFLGGTQRLDNSKDPTSAYSMMKRKQANTLPSDKQRLPSLKGNVLRGGLK